MKNLVLFLALSLVLCFVQNTQAIPQQYADDSLYQHLDDASYGENGYYSSSDLNAEHRQAFEEEDVGFFESATKSLERTWTDMSSFFWSNLTKEWLQLEDLLNNLKLFRDKLWDYFLFCHQLTRFNRGRLSPLMFQSTNSQLAESFSSSLTKPHQGQQKTSGHSVWDCLDMVILVPNFTESFLDS